METLDELINAVEFQCYILVKGPMIFTVQTEDGIFITAYERKKEAEAAGHLIMKDTDPDDPLTLRQFKYREGKREMLRHMTDLCRGLGCSGVRYIKGKNHRDTSVNVMEAWLDMEEEE